MVEHWNIRWWNSRTSDGGTAEHLMVEQWNNHDGTVDYLMVEQWNRDGGTIEHLMVRTVEQLMVEQ